MGRWKKIYWNMEKWKTTWCRNLLYIRQLISYRRMVGWQKSKVVWKKWNRWIRKLRNTWWYQKLMMIIYIYKLHLLIWTYLIKFICQYFFDQLDQWIIICFCYIFWQLLEDFQQKLPLNQLIRKLDQSNN